jgi:uncharacterized protein YndB with AHSA1/START domain
MAAVQMDQHFAVPADKVWAMIGRFHALPDWLPMIQRSEEKDGGKVRRLSLPDGSVVEEKLTDLSETDHSYSYAMISGPLPVANYHATLTVTADADGKGCTVNWESSFDPVGDESVALSAIRGVYEAGFESLKKMFPQG